MAARGNSTNNSSSSLRPSGLSSGFNSVPVQDQRDFQQYLLSQFTAWQKERRRCFYLARRSLKKKTHSTFSTCVFSSSSVSSTITCVLPQVIFSTSEESTTHRIQKQKKFTSMCSSTHTLALRPWVLTPWVEFTKRKSPLKLPSPQQTNGPHLTRPQNSTRPSSRGNFYLLTQLLPDHLFLVIHVLQNRTLLIVPLYFLGTLLHLILLHVLPLSRTHPNQKF